MDNCELEYRNTIREVAEAIAAEGIVRTREQLITETRRAVNEQTGTNDLDRIINDYEADIFNDIEIAEPLIAEAAFDVLFSEQRPSQSRVQSAKAKAIADLKKQIKEVAKKHYKVQRGKQQEITDRIIDELGLTGEDAQQLAEAIGREFNRLVQAEKEAFLKKTLTPPGQTGKTKKVFVDKLLQAVNSGALNNEEYEKAFAESLGLKQLTAEEKKRIIELGDTIQQAEETAVAAQADFTDENVAKYYEAQDRAASALKELSEIMRSPVKYADLFTTFMQAGLLGLAKSTNASLMGNIGQQLLRVPTYLISGGLDAGISKAFNRNPMFNLGARTKGYFRGLFGKRGFFRKDITDTILGIKAPELQKEVSTQLNPGLAARRLSKIIRNQSDKEFTTFSEKTKLALEATYGLRAEVMFRLLGLTDRLFSTPAEMAKAFEIAIAEKKLSGKELEKFILFPDEESQKRIKQAGLESTFQQENLPSRIKQDIIGAINANANMSDTTKGALKLLINFLFPFVKTPANVARETLKYAVFPVTLTSGIIDIRNGHKSGDMAKYERGIKNVSIGLVGAIGYIVATMMSDLVSGSGDDEDDKKVISARYASGWRPYSINWTALMRGLSGRGWKEESGDTWISYQKMGSFANVLAATKDMQKSETSWADRYMKSIMQAGTGVLDDSMLKGPADLIKALQKGGNMTEWSAGLVANNIGSMFLPSEWSDAALSMRENRVVMTKDASLLQAIREKFLTRYYPGQPDMENMVDLNGNLVKQNPPGVSPFFWNFSGIKAYDKETDALTKARLDLYAETNNTSVIASNPRNELTIDKKAQKLTPKEWTTYAQFVGRARYNLGIEYVTKGTFKEDSNADRIATIKNLDSEGLKNGKAQFLEWMIANGKTFELPAVEKPVSKTKKSKTRGGRRAGGGA